MILQRNVHGLISELRRMHYRSPPLAIGGIHHFRTLLHQLHRRRHMVVFPGHHQKRVAVLIHIPRICALFQKNFRQRPGVAGAVLGGQKLFQRRKPGIILPVDIAGKQTGDLPSLLHTVLQAFKINCQQIILKPGICQKMICIHAPLVQLGIAGPMLQQKPDHGQIPPHTGQKKWRQTMPLAVGQINLIPLYPSVTEYFLHRPIEIVPYQQMEQRKPRPACCRKQRFLPAFRQAFFRLLYGFFLKHVILVGGIFMIALPPGNKPGPVKFFAGFHQQLCQLLYVHDSPPQFFHLCGCNPMVCLHAIYGNAGGPLD